MATASLAENHFTELLDAIGDFPAILAIMGNINRNVICQNSTLSSVTDGVKDDKEFKLLK